MPCIVPFVRSGQDVPLVHSKQLLRAARIDDRAATRTFIASAAVDNERVGARLHPRDAESQAVLGKAADPRQLSLDAPLTDTPTFGSALWDLHQAAVRTKVMGTRPIARGAVPLILGLAVGALLGCGGGVTADRSAGGTQFRNPRIGLSATIPAGWHVIERRISGAIEPRQVLAAASYPVSLSKAPTRGCRPGQVLRQMPRDGALVQVIEYTPSGLGNKYADLLSRTPSRPGRFDFPYGSYVSHECSGPSYQINFKDRGRIFSAQVWMHRARVDPKTRAGALKMLNSLRFAARGAHVRARQLISRSTFLGVSCPRSNSINCDEVSLCVELRRPAMRVDASIGNREFPLRLGERLAPKRGRNFCGSLRPAGLSEDGPLGVDAGPNGTWSGDPPVIVPVTLAIQRQRRQLEIVTDRTRLMPGFG
jgi:hypothetical protein